MVEKKIDPVVKLPPEMKKRLEDSEDDLARAEHGIEVMAKLGMDTKELKEKLEWSKTVRATLLKEFT